MTQRADNAYRLTDRRPIKRNEGEMMEALSGQKWPIDSTTDERNLVEDRESEDEVMKILIVKTIRMCAKGLNLRLQGQWLQDILRMRFQEVLAEAHQSITRFGVYTIWVPWATVQCDGLVKKGKKHHALHLIPIMRCLYSRRSASTKRAIKAGAKPITKRGECRRLLAVIRQTPRRNQAQP